MIKLSFNSSNIYKPTSTGRMSGDEYHKVTASLIQYVYSQTMVGLLSSLFCASIIFIGIYDREQSNTMLYVWSGIFIAISCIRLLLYRIYIKNKYTTNNIKRWGQIYTLGCFLGGASWGLAGVILLPHLSSIQQMLLILMLAGVTAGSVPLSAAIPKAGIAFLVAALLPFIVSLILSENITYYLFDLALTLYLGYTIILTFKSYKLIKSIVILKYENDSLVDDLEISNKMLENAATHDPLTNVANRRLFEKNLEHAIERARNAKTRVALLYIDIDKFKPINDNYGHIAGDFVLKTVIYKLNMFFRKDDVIFRIGGDELAILIEDAPDKDELESIARKICQLVAMPVHMQNITMHVTVSVGVCVYPDDVSCSDDLIGCADKCMYHVKSRGGNNYHFISPKEVFVNK